MDVADVAYPIVSLGKMIESSFTFNFDDCKCCMHKGNQRVDIFRQNRIFVLRMRRRWLESKVQMVAPIDEVAEEEMEIDNDGEGARGARAEPRADEPGDEPPPPRPREVRPNSIRPGAEAVRQHILTHCPYQSWCEVCVASKVKSDHYHREAPQPMDGDVSKIQMDFMFVGAEGTFVDEPRAKSTVLMVMCKDDGNLSATEVRSKTDECGAEVVLRFLSMYENVEINTDGEPNIVEIARRVPSLTRKKQRLWHRRVLEITKTLEQWNVRMEQCKRSCERFPGRARTYESGNHSRYTVVSMDAAPFCLDGGAPPVQQRTKQTPYERTRSCRYESALVPFGEVVMAKIADADKMRASKLDSAWIKAVWVGRVDRSNEHLLLTTKDCIKSRVVRRIPDGIQANYHAEVQGLPWDTLKGSAEMSRNATVRQGEPPTPSRGRPRKDGSPAQARTTTTTRRQEATRNDPMPSSSDNHLRQPTTETDVIDQSIVTDSGTARVSDERADQGVLRMDQEEPTEKRGDNCSDQTRDSQNCCREARYKFYASIRTLRNLESIHAREKWRSTSGEKEELLKSGVDKQRWQQGDKCSMHVGWMNNTKRSHDMWSKTSRTHVIRQCLLQPMIQQ